MSDDARTVYSSESGQHCPDCGRPRADCRCKEPASAASPDGLVRVRRETKGRGGKTVTRVSGLPLAGDALKDFARRLKQRCGVGGGMDGADLVIQGDKVEPVLAFLVAEGFRAKRSGG